MPVQFRQRQVEESYAARGLVLGLASPQVSRQVGRDRVRLEAMRRAPGLRNTGDEVAHAPRVVLGEDETTR
jgi:hypothetical protein